LNVVLASVQSNFGNRPHRRLVAPRGCEWIRPILTHLIHCSLDPY